MRKKGNSSEKALKASESYVKKNEEKIRKYFNFQTQLQLKTLTHTLKRFAKTPSN